MQFPTTVSQITPITESDTVTVTTVELLTKIAHEGDMTSLPVLLGRVSNALFDCSGNFPIAIEVVEEFVGIFTPQTIEADLAPFYDPKVACYKGRAVVTSNSYYIARVPYDADSVTLLKCALDGTTVVEGVNFSRNFRNDGVKFSVFYYSSPDLSGEVACLSGQII